jgi:hypothetical protein
MMLFVARPSMSNLYIAQILYCLSSLPTCLTSLPANFFNPTMCFRNGIQYSCPGNHLLLNTVDPFTLCRFAQACPIPRQCTRVIDRFENSDDWCLDCWSGEHEGRELSGEGKRVWDDRWAGRSRWSGYGGDRGREVWREDVPQ